MADEEANDNGDEEEKTFQERVEEIREKRAKEGDEDRDERLKEAMGGGGPGGMGGNPFAQMMGGMMGGGPGGMGASRGSESGSDEDLVREVRQLRDEVRDATRQLQRIADALEE
ncbi:hypothetical protein ZOD2009_07009 [Haladaptatus paucihalophilus DX253]|uniref:Glycine-rich protein n=1 Tax=Haladaptatus paucihalophilus DX253 TaxID=797209 RepID=E7QRH9_HALPU|nr:MULTISPECIES: hypothetical protein [Haladaptatus]EFW92598.1 hypothetical protein ZOD2009_07009 [Haladaptatus paucihalophilus DX253]ODR79684.1 hypothetical protein BG842_08495 [Haladaptatus sp. W1]GKZ13801.1 hypothetical protein HAL_16820 [Haladaptatus sp. T7]SHK18048.1 hypothetical protein SAMN05444342_0858 [Haladaptatus paucihalophilus DX253]